MTEMDKFIENLGKMNSQSKQAQLRFVTCDSVDWDNKTMTATGVVDDVKYEDIVLGFGYMDIKPKKDSVCLIGIVEGNEALSFLINAETVELVEITADKIQYNGGDKKGIVISEKITKEVNTVLNRVNSIVSALQTLATAMTNTGQVPVPGAVLGSAINVAIAQLMTPLQTINQSNIENDKISH
jgi:hypothetical protein